ncbi:MAG: PIN domain-containing protein [Gammaproteobacteria bacterium]|nr:PIN domain-containing protein [Gammaproteobacteria bacterium]
MPGLIDTNLLLYAVNTDAPEHEGAQQFLTSSLETGDSWYLTEGIAYEFLRVSTHAKVFDQPLTWDQALSFLEAIWLRDNVTVLSAGVDHWSTLKERLESVRHPAGNLFFDIRSYVLMREHSIKKIYTADSDFLQFDDIEVVNPIQGRRA